MGILAAMLLFMGLYFLYDGKYGYAKANVIAEEKVKFETEYLKTFDEAKNAGKLDEWIVQAKARGMPTGEDGEPPKWPSYAAKHGWPENPKKHSAEEIYQQFQWGGAMLFLALVVGVFVLLNRNKQLTGYGQHMIMPSGSEVRYADAFKVDKRKWDNKGLAYVYYRTGGQENRATVDDLKFEGAGRVLDRLLMQFKGELIEKVPEPEESSPQSEGESGAAT